MYNAHTFFSIRLLSQHTCLLHISYYIVFHVLFNIYISFLSTSMMIKRFVETIGGAIERDVAAQELKFYIPDNPSDTAAAAAAQAASAGNSQRAGGGGGGGSSEGGNQRDNTDITTDGLSRVFIHPSSLNFSNTSFHPSNYVLYGERQLSVTPGSGSSNSSNKDGTPLGKAYIRDVSEVSPFPLLFFGGKLEAQYLQGTVTVDGWLRFSAPGRIVALVQALRRALDSLLLEKISDPLRDISTARELDAVCQLLATDGLSG
jgi:hypothetical protein